jgi:hypothetical protein
MDIRLGEWDGQAAAEVEISSDLRLACSTQQGRE